MGCVGVYVSALKGRIVVGIFVFVFFELVCGRDIVTLLVEDLCIVLVSRRRPLRPALSRKYSVATVSGHLPRNVGYVAARCLPVLGLIMYPSHAFPLS